MTLCARLALARRVFCVRDLLAGADGGGGVAAMGLRKRRLNGASVWRKCQKFEREVLRPPGSAAAGFLMSANPRPSTFRRLTPEQGSGNKTSDIERGVLCPPGLSRGGFFMSKIT